MENKFKLGDLIIGNALANKYNVSKQGWEGKVVRIINADRIEAQCLSTDSVFSLWSERFDLLKAAEPEEPNYQIY